MAVSLTREGHVGFIVFEKPPANTYDYAFNQELDACINEARMDDDLRVVVLRSAVPRFFSAGAEIPMLKSVTLKYKAMFCLHAQETLAKMERTPKIFIAAIEGHCVGGGLEIALACDLRFAGDGDYKLGLPEVKLGVLPGTGGTQRLSRLIGKSRALDMMITGELIGPQRALEIGLVNRVFPQGEVIPKTLEYAQQIIAGPIQAIGYIKLAATLGTEMPLEAGLAFERECQNRLFATPDAAEGLAAYVEKRQPAWTGKY
jgi:enoyl-CoA hydratase/carnithine racemase